MSKPTLLIVEDDEDLRTQMKWALADDYEVRLAGDRRAALEQLPGDGPAIVTLDLGLPPRAADVEEGFATLAEILERRPEAKVLVVTGREERAHALAAIAQGAWDYFQKPVRIEELKVVLRRAHHVGQLQAEGRVQQAAGGDVFEGMTGTSDAMRRVFSAVAKVAPTEATVLVVGETGTGKELVARAIHSRSPRREGPFIPINCGAVPPDLLESELFGHEKGAFTGAHGQRPGRIESAGGGTLLLDEVGELPLALQVKLLRFLQEKTITRLGGREELKVDARLVAATNRDLERMMAEGTFREDLYYRLGVVTVALPPLRERREDLPLLARALLDRCAAEAGRSLRGFSRKALLAITGHDWPGNVRELENRVRRAVVMAESGWLSPEDLDLGDPAAPAQGKDLKAARRDFDREAVSAALSRNAGNISRTAAELGVSRPTLYEMIERLGIPRG